jgi:hypothetical protein
VSAQAPRVGVIDFYGTRKTSQDELRKALQLKEGDALTASKGDVEDRLEKVPGVAAALLTATCCEDGKAILYVGVEEKGAAHFDYHDAPNGSAQLPAEIADAYLKFLIAAGKAARAGDAAEDLTRGHSFMANADARAAQERFVELAGQHVKELRAVLREAPDEEQRAMAAYVIGYAPKKTEIVDDLLYALQDPDETVRGNAMRSLGALAVLARKDPNSGVKISPTWIVEMLNSLAWTDRHNAAVTLVTLTDMRDQELLGLMKERALPSLMDMASWKHLPHALPAYILLGRMAGLSESDLQRTWSEGRRDVVLRRFPAASKRK